MKTIGFIDYYLSEWHAIHYIPWIKEYNDLNGTDYVVKYAWAEKDISEADGKSTDEFCSEFNVTKCKTIQEVCEKSDFLIVLAPSDPEKHLGYCKEVFKYKKNTYVDKTFSPDYKTAVEIFDIAKKYGTKFFSTSSLRMVTETDNMEGANSLVLIGGGGNFPEYIIHQIESLVKVMGIGARRVKVENQIESNICRVEYDDGKSATMIFSMFFPFAIAGNDKNGENFYAEYKSPTFKKLISEMIKFFETGEYFFDPNQTIEAMKIREGLLKAQKEEGKWITL